MSVISLEPTVHAPPVAPRPMTPWRRRMVMGVLLLIVGGHLIEVVTQREHWPFSPYQMWSIASTTWEMTDERTYGVTAEASPREILLEKPEYFAPLPSRFMRLHLLRGLKAKEAGKPEHLQNITRDALGRYEQRRLAGQHDGPPLQGIRIYQFKWLMDKDASNAASPQVTLMFETDGAKGVQTTGPVPTLKGDSEEDGDAGQ